MDLSLWEKAKRYRRIAAFAADDDAPQLPKLVVTPDDATAGLKRVATAAPRFLRKD